MKKVMRELGLISLRFDGELSPYSPGCLSSAGGELAADMLERGIGADFWKLKLAMKGVGKSRISANASEPSSHTGNILASCELVILRGCEDMPESLRKSRFNRAAQLAQLTEANDSGMERLFDCALRVEAVLSKGSLQVYSRNMICAIDRIATAVKLRGSGVGGYFISNLPDLVHLYVGSRPKLLILQRGDYSGEAERLGIEHETYIEKLYRFYAKNGFEPVETYLPETTVKNSMVKVL